MTSRVRLARNLSDYPFPIRATRPQVISIMELIKTAIEENTYFGDYIWISLEELNEFQRYALMEEHLISPSFTMQVGTGRAVSFNLTKDESLMINEEDHIRIQIMESGLNLKKCWMRANRIDDQLEQKLDFAFSSDFGYKTTCPTNMGTALRASVMLHLPALKIARQIDRMKQYMEQLGITIRGIYGEGTENYGSMFQFSNQSSIGISEDEIVDKLTNIVTKVEDEEKNVREHMLFENRDGLLDQVSRERAVLMHAHILPIGEFMEKFSIVRMGMEMELLPPISQTEINLLILTVQPGILKLNLNISDNEKNLDMQRARIVRELLQKWN